MTDNPYIDRINAVLRAESNGTDLRIDRELNRVYVCCEDTSGKLRVMGHVDKSLLDESPETFYACVAKIKYGEREND